MRPKARRRRALRRRLTSQGEDRFPEGLGAVLVVAELVKARRQGREEDAPLLQPGEGLLHRLAHGGAAVLLRDDHHLGPPLQGPGEAGAVPAEGQGHPDPAEEGEEGGEVGPFVLPAQDPGDGGGGGLEGGPHRLGPRGDGVVNEDHPPLAGEGLEAVGGLGEGP